MKASHPLAGTRPPTAPAELRARVLGALCSDIPLRRLDGWDRIWNSRRLRLAWLSTVLVLLALNLSPSRQDWGRASMEGPVRAPSLPSEAMATLGLDQQTLTLYRHLRAETRLHERVEVIVDLVGRQ